MNKDTQELMQLGDTITAKPPFTDKTIFHVGVSGGKDSSAALIWMLNKSGIPKEQITASFCDIGNDHPWTIQHVEYLNKNIHPILTVYPDWSDCTNGRRTGPMGFFDLALFKHRFPSTKSRFCTEFLKIYPTQRHIRSLQLLGYDVIAVSGVRADESDDRAKLLEWDYSGNLFCYEWRPLITWKVERVFALHTEYNVPLNPLYSIGALRVGCWPCIMSRKSEIRTIALKFPERIDEIRKAEQEFETIYGRYSSFFHAKTVPPRFRTKPFFLHGEWIMVCTIDDVVRWSLTGDRAEGQWDDEDQPEKEPVSCNSGYCE